MKGASVGDSLVGTFCGCFVGTVLGAACGLRVVTTFGWIVGILVVGRLDVGAAVCDL